MRLDKFLTETTDLSRSDAKKVVHRGDVTVDGEVVKNTASAVKDGMRVEWNGEHLELMGLRYLMLYKPANVECTSKPGLYERAHDLIDLPNVERLSIVGRLDVDTTGLVLMTDDGQWNHRVTSPKKACAKRYRVTLARPLEGDELARAVEDFDHGLMLDGEEKPTRPARLEMETATVGLLWITEGRYHQVKRMFAAIGNRVEALHREAIGAVELDPELEPGECRFLRPEEIASF